MGEKTLTKLFFFFESKLRIKWVLIVVLILYQMEMLDCSIIMQTRQMKSIKTSVLLPGKESMEMTWLMTCLFQYHLRRIRYHLLKSVSRMGYFALELYLKTKTKNNNQPTIEQESSALFVSILYLSVHWRRKNLQCGILLRLCRKGQPWYNCVISVFTHR